MDDDIVTTTPEPPPAPEPPPELSPSPEPEPAPAPSEPEPSTEPGMTVVSVEELVDRLVQSTETGEDETPEESTLEELNEEPGGGDVGVDDLVPGLIGDVVDILLGIRKGMENVESIEHVVNHPMLTMPFRDYTVTEGLLLLVLLCFFIKECMNMIRRAFSWLL